MLTRSWLRIHVTEQAVWSCLRIKSIAGHSYRACNSLKPLFLGFKISLPCRIHHEVLPSRTLCIIDNDSGIIGRVCQAVVGHAGKCVEQHPDILNTICLGTRAQKSTEHMPQLSHHPDIAICIFLRKKPVLIA